MTAHKKPVKTEVKTVEQKTFLGVTANIRNVLIAVALLFAFLSGFFKVYDWVDTTYLRAKHFQEVDDLRLKHIQNVEDRFNLKNESDLLNTWYVRYSTLDNLIKMTPDLSKIPIETRTEYNELPGKIKLQEIKVKALQDKLCGSEVK